MLPLEASRREREQNLTALPDYALPMIAPTHKWVDFELGELHLSPTIERMIGESNDDEPDRRIGQNSIAGHVARHVVGLHGVVQPESPLGRVNIEAKASGHGHVWSVFVVARHLPPLLLLTDLGKEDDDKDPCTYIGFQPELPSPNDLYGPDFG